MGAVFVLLSGGLVVVVVVLLLALRRWTLEETRRDARLLSHDAPTVAYHVPVGQDPVSLMAALSRSGFMSVVDNAGGTERLLVACDVHERAQVRSVLERAGRDDAASHVDLVRFEDESDTA